MVRRGKVIESNIKCPWCGAIYPNIRRNGFYVRDDRRVPQYYCKQCQRGFSASVIKIRFLKPPYKVEIGYRVKIEVEVKPERGLRIKQASLLISRGNQDLLEVDLKQQKDGLYKSAWDIKNATAGRYILKAVVTDSQGNISSQTKVITVVQHYDVIIWRVSAEYKIDPFLIKGMIWEESSFNPKAESSAKARGLTQLTPITLRELEKEEYGGIKIKDPFDSEQNIRGGVCYLAKLIKRFGSVRLALGAYNWGSKNVRKKAKKQEVKFPKSVREYINQVLKFKAKCEADYLMYYETE